MTKYINVIINYGAHKVSGAPRPVVHAMSMDDHHLTICGKRPIRWSVTDSAGKSTTCEKCLEVMGQAIVVRRETRGRKRKVQPAPDPLFEQQMTETRYRSRALWITEKGYAALAKWEAEDKATRL